MAVIAKKLPSDFPASYSSSSSSSTQHQDEDEKRRNVDSESLVSQMRSRFEAVKNNQELTPVKSVKPSQVKVAVKKVEEDVGVKPKKNVYKLKSLPPDLGSPPEKPSKPDFLKTLTFPKKTPDRVARSISLTIPMKRPPPKPPSDSRGKPLPPLPPVDDQFYDDNICHVESSENSHSSPAALGIPYEEEELYQDADVYHQDNESIYEAMEIEPCYNNSEKVIENVQNRKKDTLKNFKKEQKEMDKRAKERLKVLERFHLTGDEVPLETGTLKKPVRGWNLDLSGKEGERVSILRIKDNPVGKWLVVNEKGKIGYVELTNIEVNPETIRSVMSRHVEIEKSQEEDEDNIYQSIAW